MKPFDLQAAKNGAQLVTRDGRKATFVDYSDYLSYPVRVTIEGGEGPDGFTDTGSFFENEDESDHDLFMADEAGVQAISDAPAPAPERRVEHDEFRDKLIHDLAFRLLPEGHSADAVMDAVATILQRRKTL